MTCSQTPESVVADLFSQPVTIDGRTMTAREAYIRGLHAKALSGDVNSHVELERLRRNCKADRVSGAGYLIVPEAVSENEWARMAAETAKAVS